MTTKNYTMGKGLMEYVVEYFHVTKKTYSIKGYRVYATSKEEALSLCPKMTITGRVLKVGGVFSNLRYVSNCEGLKSDRGCRVF